MEYHEIGERFEYNGVVLGVAIGIGSIDDCKKCYFRYSDCFALQNTHCYKRKRLDGTPIYYKLIEQCKPKDMEQKTGIKVDNVNHPAHYNSHPSGIECIEIARHHNFNIGNTINYLWRAGLKSEEGMEDADKQVEDLNKAIWYIQDEIKRITEFKNKQK